MMGENLINNLVKFIRHPLGGKRKKSNQKKRVKIKNYKNKIQLVKKKVIAKKKKIKPIKKKRIKKKPKKVIKKKKEIKKSSIKKIKPIKKKEIKKKPKKVIKRKKEIKKSSIKKTKAVEKKEIIKKATNNDFTKILRIGDKGLKKIKSKKNKFPGISEKMQKLYMIDNSGATIYKTKIDNLLALIKKEKKISIKKAAKILKNKKNTIEEWGNILKEHELIDLEYHTFTSATMTIKNGTDNT